MSLFAWPKRLLKRTLPAPVYRTLKEIRHIFGAGGNALSPADRASMIAALAEPVRRRERGWVEVFKEIEKLGLHLFPVHFYSPLPDTQELLETRHRWWRETDMSVLRYDRGEEVRLNRIFAEMQDESASLPDAEALRAAGAGLGYGEVEAVLLYKMLRHLTPRRMIEVGSGVSTFYAAQALAANAREGRPGTLTCVEPFPSDKLKSGGLADRIIEAPVQDVARSTFAELGDGDVLFIDSSHVVRIGSDVNYLLLDVVPSLNPGVVIHVHDIPFPYVTPREYWIFDRLMFWQEPVLLKALLTGNQTLEVIYCSSFLSYKDPAMLSAAFPEFDPHKHFPSSIWMRKR